MSTAVLTKSGKVSIPQDVIERLGLRPGDRLEFVARSDGTMVLVPKTVPLAALKGCIPNPGRAVSLEEMDEAVGEYLAEKDASSRR